MRITEKKIQEIVSPADYRRGLDYYREGRVSGYKEIQAGTTAKISCTVLGSKPYSVVASYSARGVTALCTCPRFADQRCCKHLVAALLTFANYQERASSDFSVQKILNTYLNRAQEPIDGSRQAHLVPRLIPSSLPNGYPALSFQVGFEKLYVVKNIRSFLEDVEQGNVSSYGKGLSFCHALSQFDAQSQKLINLLMNEFRTFRSFERGYILYDNYDYSMGSKGEIQLSGEAFDRWFRLYQNQTVARKEGSPVLLEEGDPPVELQIQKKRKFAELTIPALSYVSFFGNSRVLYALFGRQLLRCSDGFRERVYPLLSAGKEQMQMALRDLPAFCGCVLPEIQDMVLVEDPEGLLQEYLPEECTPCFYFDMQDDNLTAVLKFRYAEQEISGSASVNETPAIKRNVKTEQAALQHLQQYFREQGRSGFFLMEDEEAQYGFLTETLDSFHTYGEVYVSDRLQGRQVSSAKASVGISVSDGMLSLDIDTGEFPLEELEALYQSLLQKRKYHKLTDGRYLKLQDSPYAVLAEMAHMTQLPAKALRSGHVTMPAFRGLYLDGLLGKEEGLQLSRDKQFRAMIRNFKSVAESDYQVPPGLESVLRPYQKVGFQWLKTLESSHFGGILADEMGLGKTVQVIAYLATATRRQTGRPSLVVCPTSLILNWADEFARFAPELEILLMMGTAAERRRWLEAEPSGDVWVTSYDLLKRDIELYDAHRFYCCILDEGQNIKNQATLASKAVKRIVCRQRFVLTGTPIENRLSELWNLFDFLMPGYLFSHSSFVEKLERPIVQSKDSQAGLQLSRMVQPFLLRRLKRDVLKELPPKMEYVRKIQLTEEERKTYLAAAGAAKAAFADTPQGKLQILAALTRLRQICCDPNLCFENYEGAASKLDACVELCTGMAENGHQILLFSQFTSMLDRIRRRLEAAHISSYTLQGSTPKEKRAQLVKSFNAGEAQVFLISLKAGGTGLNLTAADVVIHYDPWWNLAAQNQATDRAHRMGQQACVQVYKLIAKDTIEEKILDLQARKAALMDAITGTEEQSILSMSKEELLALLD